MATKSELLKAAQEILARSPFKETELSLTASHSMLTRYGNNVISQNVEQKSLSFGIRVIDRAGGGAKTARVTGDQTDEASVIAAYERLKKILAVMPVSEEVAGLYPAGGSYQKIERPEARLPEPEQAARAVQLACTTAAKDGFEASGIFSAETQTSAFVNSAGLALCDSLSESEFACTMEGRGGAGRGFSQQADPKKLEVEAVINRALQKCSDSAGALGEAVSIEPGHYDVVLEPIALAEFLFYFQLVGLSGKAYLEDRLFCRGKLGEKILSDRISLVDDPFNSLIGGSAYDGHGVPKRKVSFIERGVLKELATDSKTAAKLKRGPTGHGTSEPNASDPVPWNLCLDFKGEKASVSELISRVKRGVFVSQFHYTNTVDVMVPSFTGMTRNGTFLIENGRITRPIKNMRFTQSAVGLFNNIEAVSPTPERVSMFFGGASLAPTALVRKFHFSSGTGF